MSWINKRFRTLISAALIISVIVIYCSIYRPMRNRLEIAALETFVVMAQAGERSVMQVIEHTCDSVEILSAQAQLQDQIVRYHNGEIDIVTLSGLTAPFFIDSVRVLQNAERAYRYVDGREIAAYAGEEESAKPVRPEPRQAETLLYEINENSLMMTVYSPLLHDGEILGTDVIQLDLSPIIDQYNRDDLYFSVIPLSAADQITAEADRILTAGGTSLADDKKTITHLHPIGDSGMSIRAMIEKKVLFADILRISRHTLTSAILYCTVFTILVSLFTMRTVRHKLNQTEKTKQLYQDYAYRDTLTGVFSRLYFDRWMKSKIENSRFVHEDISVVMIDINRYKYINDTYGHSAGDKALQRVASLIRSSLKEEDLVIRYGGDEFLLVLMNCRAEEADRILVKINNDLMKIEDMGFGISISYGIQQITDYKDLHVAVQRADKKMYESKNAYKALLWF